jgi:flagellar basal-body rod modification protein FlgD
MTTNAIDSKLLEGLGLAQRPEAKKTVGQEQFLELMIAQLRNQDPMKPLQSGEFLTQIAQFTSAAGIAELKNSFQQFSESMYSNQALQASALVGRTVLVPAGGASLAAGGTVGGAIEVTQGTPDLSVSVLDASGQLVRRVSLGAQAASLVPFSWDGFKDDGSAAAPGFYQIKAEARSAGQAIAQTTLVASRVDSVTLGRLGGGIRLNVNGLGAVDFAEVRQIQ